MCLYLLYTSYLPPATSPALLFPPSILQPVLHSCCSNPLWQLPALHSVESLPSSLLSLSPFLPVFLSISFAYLTLLHTFCSAHLLRLSFSAAAPLSRSLSFFFFLIRAPLRSPFSRSRQQMPRLRLMKHCQALPSKLCLCVCVYACSVLGWETSE